MIEARRELAAEVSIPERCQSCVTLARLAISFRGIGKSIEQITEARMSGDLMETWINGVTEAGKMSRNDAKQFIESHGELFEANFLQRLDELDKEREKKLKFAQGVINHCSDGVVLMRPVTPGVVIEAEACGSEEPELVRGVEGTEIVRVRRTSPVTATIAD